ncbi:MAG TPA: PH domain-containing protein, partial [Acidobacteriota bacterium]|nr:PH domain-containing protein [Acidobacteriota bacterium]
MADFVPHKQSFIYFTLITSLLKLTGIFIIISFFALFIMKEVSAFLKILILGAVLGIFTLIFLFQAVNTYVSYTKTRYTLLPDKIVVKSGGLFSDWSSELLLKNVTSMYVTEPFIVRQLFGTGHVLIDSAGSSIVEGTLLYIEKPVELYEKIQAQLKQNGFSMSVKKELYREKPNNLAVFLQSLKLFFTSLLVGLYVLFNFYEDSDMSFSEIMAAHGKYLIFAAGIYLFYVFIKDILAFFDMKEREYVVYDGMVTYTEGFLTFNRACIPAETITDTKITQGVVDKILNLYDIIVSCRGSKQEIAFMNLQNAAQFKVAIDSVSKDAASKKAVQTAPVVKKEVTVQKSAAKNASFAPMELQMDATRTALFFAAFFLFILVPVFSTTFFFVKGFAIFTLVTAIFWIFIAMPCTLFTIKRQKYIIEPESMTASFSFIISSNKKMLTDKITRVVFKQNPLDWLCNTQKVQFSSIGSSEMLTFANIKKTDDSIARILCALGITPQEPVHTLRSSFSFGRWICAGLPFAVIMIV